MDRSHRDVIRITGPDRLTWLHCLTTQHLDRLAAGAATEALVLSPHGHVEHAWPVDDGEADLDPRRARDRRRRWSAFLDSMRFMLRVEVEDVSDGVRRGAGADAACPESTRRRP